MKLLDYGFNLTIYYISWFGCIWFAAHGLGGWGALITCFCVVMQVLWLIKFTHQTNGLWQLILIIVIAGSLVDTFFVNSNLIIFRSNPFNPYFSPLWMISIWISFAVLYYATLISMQRYYLLALLSFFGFTLAYYVGGKMGAAVFPHGQITCLLVGSVWAILLPICLLLYHRIIK